MIILVVPMLDLNSILPFVVAAAVVAYIEVAKAAAVLALRPSVVGVEAVEEVVVVAVAAVVGVAVVVA
jgi:hypothetical protein